MDASKLRQTFEWTRDNVASFDLLIGDYFHRHNLESMEGLRERQALNRAILDGQVLARVAKDVLDSISLSAVTIRFVSDLSASTQFADRLRVQEKLYESSESFRHWIDIASKEFIKRFPPAPSEAEDAYRHSRSYQLEELAVFELLSRENFSVNVYLGAHLPITKELVAGTLRGTLPLLDELTLVELRRGK